MHLSRNVIGIGKNRDYSSDNASTIRVFLFMPGSQSTKSLYTLHLNKCRLAYELTDQAITISAIIHPSMLQPQTNMLQLQTLMNRRLPDIIDDLFSIRPIHSIKNMSEDKIESFITIPIDNCSDSSDFDYCNADSSDSDSSDSDSDLLNIKTIQMHRTLLNKLKREFDPFNIRWLGFLEPPARFAP